MPLRVTTCEVAGWTCVPRGSRFEHPCRATLHKGIEATVNPRVDRSLHRLDGTFIAGYCMSRRRFVSLLVLLPIAAGAVVLARCWSEAPEELPAPRPAPIHSDSEEPREPPLFARFSLDDGFPSTNPRGAVGGDERHTLAVLQARSRARPTSRPLKQGSACNPRSSA